MNDISLVKRAINGNEKAFETLVKNESEKLYKIAYLYVRNKEDALDILQDAICKAFISIEQLKKPEYFNTWLTKILIRTAYDVLKKRKKIVLDENIIDSYSDDSNNDVESRLDLINAISRLEKDYQTVIILFYYQDLPIHHIAETLGKPENTIKTYLRRARLELKKIVERGETQWKKSI